MRTILILALVILNISTSFGRDPRRGGIPSATQGEDLFFQGNYLEWSLNPGGIFGNRDTVSGQSYGGSHVPSTYHNEAPGRLGVVVDYDLNGFDVGNPPHSGDAFAQGYNDVGFHVSFHGQNGLEAFNNMPLLNDDDDGDTSFSPYRGCISCQKSQRSDSCEPLDEDCSCNLDIEASNYVCPFKRWDLVTSSVTDNSNSSTFSIVWVGVASAVTFLDETSGALVPTGESITITKTIWSGINDTVIFEFCDVENTGSSDLTDVSLFWTIVPTLEAFNHAGFGSNSDTDFANYFSIPYQSDGINPAPRVISYSRGQWYNMTLALGAVDQNARAWYMDASTWRAGSNGLRPYSGDTAINANQPQSTTEQFAENVMGLAINIPVLLQHQVVQKNMFWAFHASQIDYAFEELGFQDIAFTTSQLTTSSLTTSQITSAGITTSQITSSDITTSQITSSDLTTNPIPVTTGITTSAITSADITTSQITSSDLTTNPIPVTTGITTSAVTSFELTTAPLTTNAISTASVTTSDITSSPVTSSPVTSSPVTSSAITSSAMTTQALTSGVGDFVYTTGAVKSAQSTGIASTSGSASTTAARATTSDIASGQISSASSNIVTDTTSHSNDTNLKVIASIFGVAGFLLLTLAIGGIVLAIRRMRRQPIV